MERTHRFGMAGRLVVGFAFRIAGLGKERESSWSRAHPLSGQRDKQPLHPINGQRAFLLSLLALVLARSSSKLYRSRSRSRSIAQPLNSLSLSLTLTRTSLSPSLLLSLPHTIGPQRSPRPLTVDHYKQWLASFGVTMTRAHRLVHRFARLPASKS